MRSTAAQPDPDEVHLWLAFDGTLDSPGAHAHCLALLSEAERARHDALQVERVRRQYLLTRALQRAVLARALGAEPRALEFAHGGSGKPALAPPFAGTLEFNLAHSGGLVVLALRPGAPLGVDVERIDRRARTDIARKRFSAVEIRALEALPAELQALRFLELWTLKEAYLKAVGTGIAGGLAGASFALPGARFTHADEPRAALWEFRRFAIGDDHLLALALAPPAAEREAGHTPRALVWREWRADGTTAPGPGIRVLD